MELSNDLRPHTAIAEIVAVAAALALVALLGAAWYHVEFNAPATTLASQDASGWTALHGADVAIAILASGAAILVLVPQRPLVAELAVGFAVAALVLVVYHMIDKPGTTVVGYSQDVGLRIGIWLSLLAAIALSGAASVSFQGRRSV